MRRALILLVLLAVPAAASMVDELDEREREAMDGGRLVVRADESAGGPWPRLVVYTKVRASVSDVEEVFRDYVNAADYIPGLTSAEIVARPERDVYDVRYTSVLPVAGECVSLVRNRYRREGPALVVSWKLLEATHATASDGELRVEPDGDGAVLRYTNHVRPKSFLAGLARTLAVGEVRRTVGAIKAESERRGG